MIKNKIQTGLNQLGYKIERLDSTFKNNLSFKKILSKVKNYTMTNSKRIFYLHHSINHIVKNKLMEILLSVEFGKVDLLWQ